MIIAEYKIFFFTAPRISSCNTLHLAGEDQFNVQEL